MLLTYVSDIRIFIFHFCSHSRIPREYRRSQLCNLRRQSCTFCWHAHTLRARPSLSCAVAVRADDAHRRTTSRDAVDEQRQRVVFRQLVHWKRPAVGVAPESRRRVQSGTCVVPRYPTRWPSNWLVATRRGLRNVLMWARSFTSLQPRATPRGV